MFRIALWDVSNLNLISQDLPNLDIKDMHISLKVIVKWFKFPREL